MSIQSSWNQYVLFSLICEPAELCQVTRVLREHLWCCINVYEGAVSIDAALQRHRGAAHQSECQEESTRDFDFIQGIAAFLSVRLETLLYTNFSEICVFLFFFYLVQHSPCSLRFSGSGLNIGFLASGGDCIELFSRFASISFASLTILAQGGPLRQFPIKYRGTVFWHEAKKKAA